MSEDDTLLKPREAWPRVSPAEQATVVALLDSGQLTFWKGKLWDEFCVRVAAVSGDRFALPTPNGTTALLLGAMALNIGPEDEVVLPSYAYFALAAPVLLLGATPVFCDIDPLTFNVDADLLEARRTERTKAVFVTHSWGNPAPMSKILEWSKKTGIRVLSDASHAPCARIDGQGLGSFASCTCFGFGLGKAVSAGELGAVTTSDPEIYERLLMSGGVRLLPESARALVREALPLKARPHGLAVAIGHGQLGRLKERTERTRRFSRTIETALADLSCLRPQRVPPGGERVYHRLVFSLQCTRDQQSALVRDIGAAGVPVVPDEYCHPLHTWDAIRGRDFLRDRFTIKSAPPMELDNTMDLVRRTMTLKVFVQPEPANLAERIASIIRRSWERHA